MTKGRKLIALSVLLLSMVVATGLVLMGCSSSDDATTPVIIDTTLKAAKNIFLGGATTDGSTGADILSTGNYTFFHGSTSPDGKKLFVAANKTSSPMDTTTLQGGSYLHMLDANKMQSGVVDEILTAGTVDPGAGISFRSDWSPDGTKIALAYAASIEILDATDMSSLDSNSAIGGENHDAMFTDDGKFLLLTLRGTDTGGKKDGFIQVYDVVGKTAVGAPQSVCNDCHGVGVRDSVLCGLDGDLTSDGSGGYAGTIFVAGHGGHFAKVPVTISSSGTLSITSLDKIVISSVKFEEGDSQYKLHDVRKDGDTLYWSTYNTDINEQAHYGKIKVDGTGVVDVAYDLDAQVTKPSGVNAMPVYCASGQTEKYFMPITMTYPAYITVIPKSTITTSSPAPAKGWKTPIAATGTNVFADSILPDANYTFFHGSTNNAMTKMFLVANKSTNPIDTTALLGNSDMYMMDANALQRGIVKETMASGNVAPGTGISFRSDWSSDDSKIALAYATSIEVVDAANWASLDSNTGIGGENHDALFTTDDKYLILTLRGPDTTDGTKKDGFIQLYDVVNKTAIGPAVSVCNGCHGAGSRSSVLCGLDGVVGAMSGGYDGTGTVYVAGHGGHIAKVSLKYNDTTGITVTSLDKITVSMEKFTAGQGDTVVDNSSEYKLHDVRLDVGRNMLYWSTYNLDNSLKAHYGTVDLGNGNAVSDNMIDPDARVVTGPAISANAMPIYCASGQTDDTHIPITMTHEAYFTIIQK